MKKVLFVFGFGVMRGFVYIGVIEVLEKEFKFEVFLGLSIGVVIGVFYCFGYDFGFIYKVVK